MRDKDSRPFHWRERVGIEPTGDATRLPLGFEDRGGHQHPIRSQSFRFVKYPVPPPLQVWSRIKAYGLIITGSGMGVKGGGAENLNKEKKVSHEEGKKKL